MNRKNNSNKEFFKTSNMNRSYQKIFKEFRRAMKVDNTTKQQKPHNYVKNQKKVNILQIGREIEKRPWNYVKDSNQNLKDITELEKSTIE